MPKSEPNWDKILDSFDMANFLQSEPWAKMNQLIGHQVKTHFFEGKGIMSMIIKDAKRGRYLEIPGGPMIDWSDEALAKEAIKVAIQTAKEFHCVFVRFRPQLFNTPDNLDTMKHLGAKLAPMHLHAENTIWIDLTNSEEDLLANMRRQTRYEVRRAEKQEIVVTHSHDTKLFEEFHAVQAETAARQHFVPPSKKELLAEHEAFKENAEIYVAKTKDGQPIAYGLIIKYGKEAAYFEAASTDLNRKLPGAYAIQWRVIRDLKKAGFLRYNLWGIAPEGQPNHRYAKVTTFKTGFGGEIINFVPAHDIVVNKLRYLPNLIIETIRKKRRHLS